MCRCPIFFSSVVDTRPKKSKLSACKSQANKGFSTNSEPPSWSNDVGRGGISFCGGAVAVRCGFGLSDGKARQTLAKPSADFGGEAGENAPQIPACPCVSKTGGLFHLRAGERCRGLEAASTLPADFLPLKVADHAARPHGIGMLWPRAWAVRFMCPRRLRRHADKKNRPHLNGAARCL